MLPSAPLHLTRIWSRDQPHWRQRLALALLRAQRAAFSSRQLRWLTRRVSTADAVQDFCKKNSFPHSIVTLDSEAVMTPDGAAIPPPSLHFLTLPRNADNDDGPTLLYLHGGGFVNPLRGAAHMPMILRFAAACRAKQAVIVEYALAPEHPYPAQMVQCVAALRHLLVEMNLKPSKIILAGDSAGGQLVGSVLAHVIRPSPYAPPLSLRGPLRAALFVSPFASLATAHERSYEANCDLDYLGRSQVDGFHAAWKGKESEIWADLCGGEGAGEVWSRATARGGQGSVQRAMVTVGTSEVFLDCCRSFAKGMQAETVVVGRETDFSVLKGKGVVLAECEGEVHVQPALDCAVGFNHGLMMRAITSWLATV